MGTRTIVTSGYFDPLHVGHLELFEHARRLGDRLIVIVNNDIQALLKKPRPFMSEKDRIRIIQALRPVDAAILSIDADRTVCKSLERAHSMYGVKIFAKGGDRYADEIPEAEICRRLGIKIVDGLGDKVRSSSNLVAAAITTQR